MSDVIPVPSPLHVLKNTRVFILLGEFIVHYLFYYVYYVSVIGTNKLYVCRCREWVGTKRRWRPAQRPEDLLLPPTPRTNASLQIDSAVQVNLPPLTLDASLFSRSLLTGRPIPAGTSKSLSTKGTSGDVKPYAEWLRLADKVSGVREPVGEERNASMGAPRHISATGAVNGDVPGRGAASSGQAPSKWVEDDTWWLSSDEDVEAQVAPETGVEPGCAAWFSHQHNSGQRQPRALTHQQTQFEEVPAALEIFFDDVFVQKKSSEGMDEDCDGADAYRSAVTGAQSESPEDVQLSPECEVVWDSSEGEEDEGSFLYAEIATENREEGALPAPQAVYSDGLLQVEPYSATCEAGPQVEAGDENLWNGLDSVSEGDVIFQEESEHKNLAAHARTEANPWSTGRGLFSILAAGSGALFDELEAAAEDAVECIIDGEDVDLPEEYTDGYEALHHEGNIERGAGGLGVAVIMEDDSQGSNCEAKKRSRTEESPVAQKDDVEMLGGYGVDVAFEDEQEEAWEEEHTAVRRAAVLGHRRPRAGLLNTEHIIQEWRAGQRRSAMGAQVLRPAIAQVLGAQQAQRAAGEITLGKLWALCKTKIPKDSSPSRGQFLAALLAVVHHANINADAASLHNGGVAEQATVPRSGITLCRPPGHNKAMLVKWG